MDQNLPRVLDRDRSTRWYRWLEGDSCHSSYCRSQKVEVQAEDIVKGD